MLPFDIEGLVKTSAKNLSGRELDVKTGRLEPTVFSDQSGFRFAIEYFTESGLMKRDDVLAVVRDQQLYLLIYTAASIHYYDHGKTEVESLFSTATL